MDGVRKEKSLTIKQGGGRGPISETITVLLITRFWVFISNLQLPSALHRPQTSAWSRCRLQFHDIQNIGKGHTVCHTCLISLKTLLNMGRGAYVFGWVSNFWMKGKRPYWGPTCTREDAAKGSSFPSLATYIARDFWLYSWSVGTSWLAGPVHYGISWLRDQ